MSIIIIPLPARPANIMDWSLYSTNPAFAGVAAMGRAGWGERERDCLTLLPSTPSFSPYPSLPRAVTQANPLGLRRGLGDYILLLIKNGTVDEVWPRNIQLNSAQNKHFYIRNNSLISHWNPSPNFQTPRPFPLTSTFWLRHGKDKWIKHFQ